LDPPSNYFGPDRVFSEDSESVVRHIDDNEDRLPIRHKKEHVVGELPDSLYLAIRTFVVGRAIRLVRGHLAEHCSMLVNASRFTGVQGQIRAAIQHFVEDIQASVRLHAALPSERALQDREVAALRDVWAMEFSRSGVEWEQVQRVLVNAVAPIKVVEVNSRSHGTLNYDEYQETGLSVIAVGGYSLSRGLTLEGLMVSYFLRNSMMYDTLMQMGRWFGYRPDYEDLCRVFMPEDAEGWYSHIAESIELLRGELRAMSAAGATPEQFGLKVRAHPDTLIVTARNKMGAGKRVDFDIGLAKEFIETHVLRNDAEALAANRLAASRLAEELAGGSNPLSGAKSVPGGFLLTGVPAKAIRTFVTAFASHPAAVYADSTPITRYIADREDSELASWDVLVTSIEDEKGTIVDNSLGVRVHCQTRTAGDKSDAGKLLISNKQRVSSRGVEKTGLTPQEADDAEREYRESLPANPSQHFNYPDRIYRLARKRPLFILHLLCVNAKDQSRMHVDPVVAWSISFPETERPQKLVRYVVTPTWLRENFRADVDEDMADDDS
jgi:hypothetical protein